MAKSILCIFSVQFLFLLSTAAAQEFDFFYFVLQWPGAYCDARKACCFPTTGKPDADFGIHGLWPNYNDGTYPSNCDSSNPFERSKISDLVTRMQSEWPTLACPSGDGTAFWTHEWEKHGTCSESVLDQHAYFKSSLDLKDQINALEALTKAGIEPNDETYTLENIKDALKEGTGFTPFVECNRDQSGNSQLYQLYFCVDSSSVSLIDCPIYPRGKCGPQIQFPTF
uniref:S-like RNase n=1 Tax=Fagopyrum esculentum TaxID=3617 RepID=Q0KKW3_FAGES|nr:S-like RNase [Fagopyrum esculentum]